MLLLLLLLLLLFLLLQDSSSYYCYDEEEDDEDDLDERSGCSVCFARTPPTTSGVEGRESYPLAE